MSIDNEPPNEQEVNENPKSAASPEEQADPGDEVVVEAEPVENASEANEGGDETEPNRVELEAALKAAIAERDAMKDQALRFRAELDNYRKRTAREIERIRKSAAEGVVRDLLPVLDHLELALQHSVDSAEGLAEGVSMVAKQFIEVLSRHGIKPIEALGAPFDPNVHEAVMQRDDPNAPEHTVIAEFQKGYLLGGQVLRPSKVVVSVGGPERSVGEETKNGNQQDESVSEAPDANP